MNIEVLLLSFGLHNICSFSPPFNFITDVSRVWETDFIDVYSHSQVSLLTLTKRFHFQANIYGIIVSLLILFTLLDHRLTRNMFSRGLQHKPGIKNASNPILKLFPILDKTGSLNAFREEFDSNNDMNHIWMVEVNNDTVVRQMINTLKLKFDDNVFFYYGDPHTIYLWEAYRIDKSMPVTYKYLCTWIHGQGFVMLPKTKWERRKDLQVKCTVLCLEQ